jgi:hypothetical protein
MCGVSGDSGGESRLGGGDGWVAAAIDILSCNRSFIGGSGSTEGPRPVDGDGEINRSIGCSSGGEDIANG